MKGPFQSLRFDFKLRISLAFFLIAAIISTIIFQFFYKQTQKDHFNWLSGELKNVTQMAASQIRGEEVLEIPLTPGCEENPVHIKMVEKLKALPKMDARIADAYVLVPTGKMFQLQFVVNADREVTPVGCGEKFDISEFKEMQNGFKLPSVDLRPVRDKWGVWFSGYAPVFNAQGKAVALLGLDIAETTIQAIQAALFERYVFFLILILTISLLMGFVISNWLTRPLEHIIQNMEKISEGQLDCRLDPSPMSEFDQIGQHFNKMATALKENMVELANTVRRQERISRELEIAAELQSRALPASTPHIEDLDLASRSITAAQVGGDYYDFIRLNEDQTGFVIADATGKGISGALYMTTSRSLFHLMTQNEPSPSQVLEKTNNVIANESISGTGLFITLFYGLYDRRSGEFVYANAGHNLPIIYRVKQQTFEFLKTRSIPIGIVAEQSFPETSVKLESGDVLLLYTDGLTEAKDKNHEMFGIDRLKAAMSESAWQNAEQILGHLTDQVREFSKGMEQHDDITLMILKKK